MTRIPPGVAVVALPYKIDYANAPKAAEKLGAAFAPGATTIVVDLTLCTFADTAGARALVLARRLADADGTELRVVVPPALRRSFGLMALDQIFQVYPTLDAALSGVSAADGAAGRGESAPPS